MVGTPSKMVAPYSHIIRMASSGSNRSCRMRVAPTRKVVLSATDWPKVWNRGREPMTTSSPLMGWTSNALTVAFITRLRWVSMAPLGTPVVPLV